MSENIKDESRMDIVGTHTPFPHSSRVQLGCLQRIAESLEKMEDPFASLLKEQEYLNRTILDQKEIISGLKALNEKYTSQIARLQKKEGQND